jgi:hypothetical protein
MSQKSQHFDRQSTAEFLQKPSKDSQGRLSAKKLLPQYIKGHIFLASGSEKLIQLLARANNLLQKIDGKLVPD